MAGSREEEERLGTGDRKTFAFHWLSLFSFEFYTPCCHYLFKKSCKCKESLSEVNFTIHHYNQDSGVRQNRISISLGSFGRKKC